MPLERFYRLPEEKQMAIRRAAMKEFARVPFDKASINKIIKDADISRGSFYTYFEDKWDVLSSIFENWQKKMRIFCVESVRQHDGDIWRVLEDFLDEAIEFCSRHNSFEFVRNVMAHSNSEDMFSGFSAHEDAYTKEQNAMERWMYEQVDKSGFKSDDFIFFHRFMMIAMSSMAMAMREYYRGQTKEAVKEEFSKKLELLRYGVCSG